MSSPRVVCSWSNRVAIAIFFAVLAGIGTLLTINLHSFTARAIAGVIALACAVAVVRSLRLGVACTRDGFEVREVGTTARLPFADVAEVRYGVVGRGAPSIIFLLRNPYQPKLGSPRRRVVAHSLGSYAIFDRGVRKRGDQLAAILEEHQGPGEVAGGDGRSIPGWETREP